MKARELRRDMRVMLDGGWTTVVMVTFSKDKRHNARDAVWVRTEKYPESMYRPEQVEWYLEPDVEVLTEEEA